MFQYECNASINGIREQKFLSENQSKYAKLQITLNYNQ